MPRVEDLYTAACRPVYLDGAACGKTLGFGVFCHAMLSQGNCCRLLQL